MRTKTDKPLKAAQMRCKQCFDEFVRTLLSFHPGDQVHGDWLPTLKTAEKGMVDDTLSKRLQNAGGQLQISAVSMPTFKIQEVGVYNIFSAEKAKPVPQLKDATLVQLLMLGAKHDHASQNKTP